MSPKILAALVDAAIPFFGGIYVTLMAYRVVGKEPGESPTYDEWHRKHGGLLKIGGPFLVLFSIFLAAMGIART